MLFRLAITKKKGPNSPLCTKMEQSAHFRRRSPQAHWFPSRSAVVLTLVRYPSCCVLWFVVMMGLGDFCRIAESSLIMDWEVGCLFSFLFRSTDRYYVKVVSCSGRREREVTIDRFGFWVLRWLNSSPRKECGSGGFSQKEMNQEKKMIVRIVPVPYYYVWFVRRLRS